MSYIRFNQLGFTLVEITSVLLASSALAIAGLPMISDLSAQVKATGTQELFAEALARGRNHAVTQGQIVRVCGSADGKTCSSNSWAGGWLVQSIGVEGEDGTASAPGKIISSYHFEDASQTLKVIDEKSQVVSEIRFDTQGFNKTQQRLEARICSPEHKPLGDMVIIERNGRVRVTGNPSASAMNDSAKSDRSSQCKQA